MRSGEKIIPMCCNGCGAIIYVNPGYSATLIRCGAIDDNGDICGGNMGYASDEQISTWELKKSCKKGEKTK